MARIQLPPGFSRLPNIIGGRRGDQVAKPIMPVSKSAWWEGVRTGRYPPGIKLGPNTTAWRNEHLQELIDDPYAPREARSWNCRATDHDSSLLSDTTVKAC